MMPFSFGVLFQLCCFSRAGPSVYSERGHPASECPLVLGLVMCTPGMQCLAPWSHVPAHTEQEGLTDELLGMSAVLKRNALAMQQSVANRGALLEETDESIERNLAMQQQSVKRSKEEYRRYASCPHRKLWHRGWTKAGPRKCIKGCCLQTACCAHHVNA